MNKSNFIVSPSIISACIIKFQEFCDENKFDYRNFATGLLIAASSDGVNDSFIDVPQIIVNFRRTELFQNLLIDEEKFIYSLILKILS